MSLVALMLGDGRVQTVGAGTLVTLCLCATAGAAQSVDDTAVGGPVRPVPGAVITQGFGCTAYPLEPVEPFCPGGHYHSGIDLAAPLGTPVRATLGGDVSVVRSTTGYGLHVIVDHGGGLLSLYGHLSSVGVADGALVEAGEVIGAVGSTGNSSGPHLHFEIRRNGIPVDPSLEVALP